MSDTHIVLPKVLIKSLHSRGNGLTHEQLEKLLTIANSPEYSTILARSGISIHDKFLGEKPHHSSDSTEPVPIRHFIKLKPMSENPTIGIGITTYKRPEMLKKCLAEFRKFIPPNATLLVNDDSIHEEGIAKAKNRCIAALDKHDYIFLFDDDCWPCVDKWWEFFIDRAIKYKCHFVSPYWDLHAVKKNHDGILEQKWVSGQCLFFTKEHVGLVGGMNTAYLKYGGEHEEYARRSYYRGLTPYILCDFEGSIDQIYAVDRYATESITTVSPSDLRNNRGAITSTFLKKDSSWYPYKSESFIITWLTETDSPILLKTWIDRQPKRCIILCDNISPSKKIVNSKALFLNMSWWEFMNYLIMNKDYIQDLTFKSFMSSVDIIPTESSTVPIIGTIPYPINRLQCVKRFGNCLNGDLSTRTPALVHLPKAVWEEKLISFFVDISHPMNETILFTPINRLHLMAATEVDMRPVLMILGCQKYIQTLQLAIARFSGRAWHIVGIVGGASVTTFSDNILYLNVSDLYDDLPKKVYEAYVWIRTTFPLSVGVFKTDEDIYIDDLDLFEYSVLKNHTTPYWGFHKEVATKPDNISELRIEGRFSDKTTEGKVRPAAIYCWGHGYWLSQTIVDYLVNKCKESFYTQYLEDVCVGSCINRTGIVPTEIKINYIEVVREELIKGNIVKQIVL